MRNAISSDYIRLVIKKIDQEPYVNIDLIFDNTEVQMRKERLRDRLESIA